MNATGVWKCIWQGKLARLLSVCQRREFGVSYRLPSRKNCKVSIYNTRFFVCFVYTCSRQTIMFPTWMHPHNLNIQSRRVPVTRPGLL